MPMNVSPTKSGGSCDARRWSLGKTTSIRRPCAPARARVMREVGIRPEGDDAARARPGSRRPDHSLYVRQKRLCPPEAATPPRAAARPSTVGFPSTWNATPGGNASPVSAASNTSPHISDAVPMSKMTGPEGYRVGAESRAGCAGRHDVRRATGGVQADKSGIDDAFEVIGVAPAEIAAVDADGRGPGLFRLGNRDFGAAIDGDIADIVAAIDEGGDGCFVHDGDGDAGVPGLRITRDCEDARQPGEPVAASALSISWSVMMQASSATYPMRASAASPSARTSPTLSRTPSGWSGSRFAFFSRFGEAGRTVRFLPDNANEAGRRIYELHKRHANEVCAVIDNAIRSNASALRSHSLPASCLLVLALPKRGDVEIFMRLLFPENRAAEETGMTVFSRDLVFELRRE